MRLIFSEYQADYQNYRFPYQIYAQLEENESPDKAYESGFLASRIRKGLFLLSRSLRVDLQTFEMSSENRRIASKTEFLKVEMTPLDQFEYSYEIGKFAKDFYTGRFGENVLSPQKAKWVFTSGAFTHVLIYRDENKSNEIIGYCPAIKTEKLMHYAYPFYDLNYLEQNLGMGMMLSAINLAKDSGLSHIYLGNVYTEESLYKTQFKGVEWFDGTGWSGDIEKLKELIRNPIDSHRFKDLKYDTEKLVNSGIDLR